MSSDTLSLVNRLAPEILSMIFICSLPEVGVPSLHESPLILLQVCQYWRNVAYTTPELWTTLNFHLRPATLSPRALLSLWLDRSGILPIDFRMEIEGSGEVLTTIFTNFHRFRALDISVGYIFIKYLRGIRRGPVNASALESLTIADSTWEADYDSLKGRITTPKLHHLTLRGPGLALPILSLDFHKLRSLTVDEGIVLSTYTNLINDLRQCDCLEELQLSLCSPILHPADEIPGGPLSFPQLRKFCVVVDTERDPRPFLAALRLPKLEDLEIRRYKAHFFSGLLYADYMEPLILPVTPRLRSLTLGYFTDGDVYEGVIGSPPINQYRLPDLLRKLPTLESLTIHEGRLSNRFIDSLIPSPNSLEQDVILPVLSKLTLRHAQFAWDPIIRFVAARSPREKEANRWRTLRTLMAVECHPNIPMENHHKDMLNAICQESGQAFRWVYNISPIN
ncbi:hypothetical protein M422DRAFT_780424 [Sphaerobolus stellatus SS14]|uniref:F-box domain-containing protein n=1 Tax=Sphaerobolus stellatus (strain SS14) TaxID=990650 RepID=A0A0C9VIG6_SPHS4|nr:hypothetical protein M422DRAFT_780424 [Sphaerobolus stellatus SS14]